MTRSTCSLLACLALSVGCANKNANSENPDAGQYDGYTSETGASDDGSVTDGGEAATPTGPRPKARASTSTRSGARKTGKSLRLVAKKPAVTTTDKPRPTRKLKAEFGVDGVYPTSAAVGSQIEIFGSGFPEDGKTKVFIGNKPVNVVEVTPDRIVAELTAPATGKVEVGLGTGRINKRGRAKTNGDFMVVAADGAFAQPRTRVGHGLLGQVFAVDEGATEVPDFNALGAPLALVAFDDLDIPAGEAAGLVGRGNGFGIHFQGSLNIVEEGEYELCLSAGDGALLFLDQTPVIDNDGTGATREVCEVLFAPAGEYAIDLLYYQAGETEAGLTLSWAKDGGAKEPIPADALFPPESLYDIAVGFDQG
ncbi:MAG: IPT/TIG domain-containing protein [Deltaproteobacteria bacterium]|nr:IPT/TIG domain-containing protein [Deltaproteobacteria bacterium]